MGKTDLQLRNKAIPFQAQVHGLNSTPLSSQKISMAAPLGDLLHLAWQGNGNSQRYYPVRFLKPFAGQITQAYFTLDFKIATAGTVVDGQPIAFYIGAAPFNTDKMTLKPYSAAIERQIMDQHPAVMGSPAPLTGPNGTRMQIDALDILKLIPTDPSSEFYSDQFFSLALFFEKPPSKGGGFELLKFKVDAAVNLGGF